jgi:hypothetical protein
MRRVLYEWGAIFCCAFSIVAFFYWAISISRDFADFEVFLPLGHWGATQITAADGMLTVNDSRGTLEVIEMLEKYGTIYPPPSGRHRLSIPGLQIRVVRWPDGPSQWSVDFSLLIAAFLSTIGASFCIGDTRASAARPEMRENRTAQTPLHGARLAAERGGHSTDNCFAGFGARRRLAGDVPGCAFMACVFS